MSVLPKCCGEVVENSACGKNFFYCRGCKKEITDTMLDLAPEAYTTLPNNIVLNNGASQRVSHHYYSVPTQPYTPTFTSAPASQQICAGDRVVVTDVKHPFFGLALRVAGVNFARNRAILEEDTPGGMQSQNTASTVEIPFLRLISHRALDHVFSTYNYSCLSCGIDRDRGSAAGITSMSCGGSAAKAIMLTARQQQHAAQAPSSTPTTLGGAPVSGAVPTSSNPPPSGSSVYFFDTIDPLVIPKELKKKWGW